jgi:diaminopimelate epimerase
MSIEKSDLIGRSGSSSLSLQLNCFFMPDIKFYKYHGAGNDFILIDNRALMFDAKNVPLIEAMCHRRFGIGADGLMLLQNSDKFAFSMRYFNSDGREATMCGNGGRCIVAFAEKMGLVDKDKLFGFEAVDGRHEAICQTDYVRLKMVDVNGIEELDGAYYLNTGSPHHVSFHTQIDGLDVFNKGRAVRYSDRFKPEGTNVNFVEVAGDGDIKVRTYERGVEDETWACGTGCVASVLTDYYVRGKKNNYQVTVLGGELKVSFEPVSKGVFKNIWLDGPAKFVFEGHYSF